MKTSEIWLTWQVNFGTQYLNIFLDRITIILSDICWKCTLVLLNILYTFKCKCFSDLQFWFWSWWWAFKRKVVFKHWCSKISTAGNKKHDNQLIFKVLFFTVWFCSFLVDIFIYLVTYAPEGAVLFCNLSLLSLRIWID